MTDNNAPFNGNGYATARGIFMHGQEVVVMQGERRWAGKVHGQCPNGHLIIVGHDGAFGGQHTVDPTNVATAEHDPVCIEAYLARIFPPQPRGAESPTRDDVEP